MSEREKFYFRREELFELFQREGSVVTHRHKAEPGAGSFLALGYVVTLPGTSI